MSTADHILDQIDTALGDYSISDDAMRSRPDLPPLPARTIVRPHANGSTVIVRRLIERHDLSPEEARAAVLHAERGQATPHAELAAAEALAIAAEMRDQIRAGFQVMAEHVAEQFKQIRRAFEQLQQNSACDDHHTPPPRLDRPAWQTPYGPPQRRR